FILPSPDPIRDDTHPLKHDAKIIKEQRQRSQHNVLLDILHALKDVEDVKQHDRLRSYFAYHYLLTT
ncbi:TPA: hypothetical protein ACH0UC_004843, partial [Escherichia coli]